MEKNNSVQQAKFFLRHVDDIVSAVTGDPEEVLRATNLLNPCFQFTIETPKTSEKKVFLDLQTSTDKNRKTNCGCYQKPTDSGTILKF